MKATLQDECVRLMAVTPKYDILEFCFVISGAFVTAEMANFLGSARNNSEPPSPNLAHLLHRRPAHPRTCHIAASLPWKRRRPEPEATCGPASFCPSQQHLVHCQASGVIFASKWPSAEHEAGGDVLQETSAAHCPRA